MIDRETQFKIYLAGLTDSEMSIEFENVKIALMVEKLAENHLWHLRRLCILILEERVRRSTFSEAV